MVKIINKLTSGDDYFQSSDGKNHLVWGYEGNDQIYTSKGNDTLQGGEGNDSLHAGAGNDLLIGGSGNDLISGGRGIDTVSYKDSTSGVYVNMSDFDEGFPVAHPGTAADGLGGVDTLSPDIENIVGSSYDDCILGSKGNNLIQSGAGNDDLRIDSGFDTVYGGSGNDIIYGYHDSSITDKQNNVIFGEDW